MKETEKAIIRQKKRCKLSKMTVQAYTCACGATLECSMECQGVTYAFAANAARHLDFTAVAIA